MKVLGILLVGATVYMAGCACDCNDKVGENGFRMDSSQHMDGIHTGSDADHTHMGGGTETGNHSGTDRGNTSTSMDGTSDNSGSATVPAGTDKNSIKAKDPRTYQQSGNGVGYRTDTIDEYKGIGGSARDKGPIDKVPNPK
ncbi:hypothetical protein BH09BAC1_BH09BAC1_12850 [soil metagenome]